MHQPCRNTAYLVGLQTFPRDCPDALSEKTQPTAGGTMLQAGDSELYTSGDYDLK